MTDQAALDADIRSRESAVFEHYGLASVETTVALSSPQVGVRLLEFGSDQPGPPVLLLHGIGSISALAAPLIPSLCASRRVIAVDWPGHGLSDSLQLPPGASIREHAVTVLTGLCDALDIAQADFVGHSLGAQFSLYTALDAPALVRRIVTLGAPGAGFVGTRPSVVMRGMSVGGLGPLVLRMPMPAWLYRRANEAALGRGVMRDLPSQLLEVGQMSGRRPGYAASVASFFRAMVTPAGIRPGVAIDPSELASVEVPTLLIWGDRDMFLRPGDAGASIAAIPQASLLEVAGAGHAPWLNEPELCAKAVADFVNDLGSPS